MNNEARSSSRLRSTVSEKGAPGPSSESNESFSFPLEHQAQHPNRKISSSPTRFKCMCCRRNHGLMTLVISTHSSILSLYPVLWLWRLIWALLSVLPSLSYKYVDTAHVFPHYIHLTLDVSLFIEDARSLGLTFSLLAIMFFVSGYIFAKNMYPKWHILASLLLPGIVLIFLLPYFFQGLSSSFLPDYYSRIPLTSVITFILFDNGCWTSTLADAFFTDCFLFICPFKLAS